MVIPKVAPGHFAIDVKGSQSGYSYFDIMPPCVTVNLPNIVVQAEGHCDEAPAGSGIF